MESNQDSIDIYVDGFANSSQLHDGSLLDEFVLFDVNESESEEQQLEQESEEDAKSRQKEINKEISKEAKLKNKEYMDILRSMYGVWPTPRA
jgi:hypothetical protein